MIVPSMTAREIHREVYEDIATLGRKFDACEKDFQKIVLKNNRYPIVKSYDCRTAAKKNLFVLTFTAYKRSDWKNLAPTLFAVYSFPEGKYAAAILPGDKSLTIYPPHFFKRYRERIVKDDTISNDDIIRRYFKNERALMCAAVNKDYETVYHCFEKDTPGDKLSFIAAGAEGFCFGEKQGNIDIIKTIISEDMLFDKQKPIFERLKRELIKAQEKK